MQLSCSRQHVWLTPNRGGRGRPRAAAAHAAKLQAAVPPLPALDLPGSVGGQWLDGVHYTLMEVRDTELDQFQVVNNSVYAAYFTHARHKALADMGMPVETWQAQGVLMALSELSIQYKAPLRAGSVFVTTCACSQMSAARVTIEQSVQEVRSTRSEGPERVVCAQGQATLVFLDSAYRPIRVPPAAAQVLGTKRDEYLAALAQRAEANGVPS